VERPVLLGWAIDIEPGAHPINRREERESLNVIPMDVGDQGARTEAAIERLGGGEIAQTSAEVEQDRVFALALEGERRGVPAVARV